MREEVDAEMLADSDTTGPHETLHEMDEKMLQTPPPRPMRDEVFSEEKTTMINVIAAEDVIDAPADIRFAAKAGDERIKVI